jgi:hypothetical protein
LQNKKKPVINSELSKSKQKKNYMNISNNRGFTPIENPKDNQYQNLSRQGSTPVPRYNSTSQHSNDSRFDTPSLSSEQTDIAQNIFKDLGILTRAQDHALNCEWEQVRKELCNIENPNNRDKAYQAFAEIATGMAFHEIKENKKPTFDSPAAIKAYQFATEISNGTLKKQTLENIEQVLIENDNIEGPVTLKQDEILSDFAIWREAELAAYNKKWSSAHRHLQAIKDPFHKDLAYLNIAEIAIVAAKDVFDKKKQYHQAMLTVHSFGQEIESKILQEHLKTLIKKIGEEACSS